MRYYCFPRAINVGGHVVTMKTLKGIFESIVVNRSLEGKTAK